MKIQNRENTISLTGRLGQDKRAEVIVREYLDTVIFCQIQHHIDGTERLPGFLLLFMLCPQLSLFSQVVLIQRSVPGKKVGVASLMFLCNNKLHQCWAVLTTGITVSPYGLLPIRVQGSWNAKLGPNYFTGGWNSAICHVHYNSEFTFSKCWITALGDEHMRSRPEFRV